MNQVTVNRLELLEKISANRDAHRGVFEEAIEGYRKAAIEELERSLHDAKKGKKVCRYLALVEPEDHTSEYETVIDMLKYSVDENVTLDARSYARYALDKWEWKAQFAGTVNSYLAEPIPG